MPWTEANKIEKAREVIEKACSQGQADIESFSELASHFLTKEQFKMISFQFNITMSDLSGIPESDLCPTCRETYVFEEDKGKGDTQNPIKEQH